jgi:hypothetical protein
MNVWQNLLSPPSWYFDITALIVYYSVDVKSAFTFIKVRVCHELRAVQVCRCSRMKRRAGIVVRLRVDRDVALRNGQLASSFSFSRPDQCSV